MHYHLLTNGEYLLKDGDTIIERMKEVSLLINKHTGELIAHGSPATVALRDHEYVDVQVRAGANPTEVCNGLMGVSGKIPVDILNKCIDVPGYAAKFFAGRKE